MRKTTFDYEINYGKNVWVCTGKCSYGKEEWGADADGHRGQMTDWLEIDSIDITNENGNEPDKETADALWEVVNQKLGEELFEWADQGG